MRLCKVAVLNFWGIFLKIIYITSQVIIIMGMTESLSILTLISSMLYMQILAGKTADMWEIVPNIFLKLTCPLYEDILNLIKSDWNSTDNIYASCIWYTKSCNKS